MRGRSFKKRGRRGGYNKRGKRGSFKRGRTKTKKSYGAARGGIWL